MTLYKSNTISNKVLLVISTALLGMSSCGIVKPYHKPVVKDNVATQLYRDDSTVDSSNMAQVPWQELFADAKLQTLITEGLSNNVDLKNAIEQMIQADASFKQSRLAFLPSVNFTPQATYNKNSKSALNFPPTVNINLETFSYQLGLSASWELDIWGKMASAKRAAYAALLRSDATKRAIQTQLIATIANYYYRLLALDKQLQITNETLSSRGKAVETMKTLKQSAVVNGAAVVQSEANLYAVEVTVPELLQSIRETENALCTVLGRVPTSIDRSTIETQTLYKGLAVGVPMQLLSNRPDVQAAELAFRSAFENTNNARTFFYPSLTLTGSTGMSALSTNPFWSTASIFGNVIGGLTQPIFNKGLNKARLTTAQSQQQQALNNFHQSLLVAGQEVSNALFAYQTLETKTVSRVKQIAALQKAVEYTKELLQYSSATNYTDVLTSEQSLLSAQLASVNDQLQQLQAVVNLYRALGGGWKN
jgi:multidrug efflux system outer membrane protein